MDDTRSIQRTIQGAKQEGWTSGARQTLLKMEKRSVSACLLDGLSEFGYLRFLTLASHWEDDHNKNRKEGIGFIAAKVCLVGKQLAEIALDPKEFRHDSGVEWETETVCVRITIMLGTVSSVPW